MRSRNGPIGEPWTGGAGTKAIQLARSVPGLEEGEWEGGPRGAHQVDAVARREVELQRVRLLQELDGQRQQLRRRERQMIAEDGHLVLAAGEAQRQRRLQTAEDVVGHLVG